MYENFSLFHCKFKQNCNFCSITANLNRNVGNLGSIFIKKLLVTASKVIHRHSPSLKSTVAGIYYFRPKIRTHFFVQKQWSFDWNTLATEAFVNPIRIHIWHQMFFLGIFDLPTYPNQMLYYIHLFSKIRCSLTYLKIWRHMWILQ